MRHALLVLILLLACLSSAVAQDNPRPPWGWPWPVDPPPTVEPPDYVAEMVSLPTEDVIQRLASHTTLEWRAAKDELLDRGDDVLSDLIEALEDPEPRVRGRVVTVLGLMRGEEVEALLPRFVEFTLDDIFVAKRAIETLGKFGERAAFAIPDILYAHMWFVNSYSVSQAAQAALVEIIPGTSFPLTNVWAIYRDARQEDRWRNNVALTAAQKEVLLSHYVTLLDRAQEENWEREQLIPLEYAFVTLHEEGSRVLAEQCAEGYEIQHLGALVRAAFYYPEGFDIEALCVEYQGAFYRGLAYAGNPQGVSLWLIDHLLRDYLLEDIYRWTISDYEEAFATISRMLGTYPEHSFTESRRGPRLPGLLDDAFRARLLVDLARQEFHTRCFSAEELEHVSYMAMGALGIFGTAEEIELIETNLRSASMFGFGMAAWDALPPTIAITPNFLEILSEAYADETLTLEQQDRLLNLLLKPYVRDVQVSFGSLRTIRRTILSIMYDVVNLGFSGDDQLEQFAKISAAITVFCEDERASALEDFMMEIEYAIYSSEDGAYNVLDTALFHWNDRDALLDELRGLHERIKNVNDPELEYLIGALAEILEDE